MPEVGGVSGGGISPQNQNQVDRAITPVNQANTNASPVGGPVGQPGALGQPTGIPAPVVPGQTGVMSDVLAGRDASQVLAAERMRASGGASATDELLGLNRQPTILGALAPPPGNSEALRHMTPTMRRTLMRSLLDKQRARMRHLAHTLRREQPEEESEGERRQENQTQELVQALVALDDAQAERAWQEVTNAGRMLDLLDELLAMQDYAFSQMGTFSHG